MKRSAFNIIVAIFAIIYVGVIALGNVFVAKVPVATIPGSYAEIFANEKKLEQASVPDSMKNLLDLKYETFEYNVTDLGTISIEKYNGISSDLVLPETIEGVVVTKIGENFFNDLKASSVYFPRKINEVAAEPTKAVKIICDKDNAFYKENKDGEDWNFEEAYDSTYYQPDVADIPFAYNDNGSTIELTGYLGNDAVVAIPSYIDGKPVTTVAFDLLGNFDLVIFPETVTAITGKVSTVLFTPVFAVEIVLSVLAILIVLVAVNIILPRYKKNNAEYLLSAPQMIMSIAYLGVQLALCVWAIYFAHISAGVALVISLAILFVYLVFVLAANRGREHAATVTAKVKEETANIRNLQTMVKGLGASITDPEVKKQVDRVDDAVRFTSARSKNDEIEKQVAEEITALKGLIKDGEKEEILKKCQEIVELMGSR